MDQFSLQACTAFRERLRRTRKDPTAGTAWFRQNEPEGDYSLQHWSETVDRAQKEKLVDELGQIFESSGVVVVAHYAGLTVAEMQDLRGRMRAEGGSVRVAKNKLAKIALEGKPNASIGDLLTGMTVLAYSEDPVAAAKVAEDYAKDNKKFEILGGAMGETALDRAGVEAVSKMPSRDELIASIVGLHRRTCCEHRWGHWRTCFEHREHSLDHRGTRGSGLKAIWIPAFGVEYRKVGTHLNRTEQRNG